MEWVESTGPTIEEAKEAALDRLGVHEDDAEFEVLTEARTGLFGRVKEDARVRARVRPTAPRAKEERRRGRGRGRSGSGRGGARNRSSNGSGGDERPRAGAGRSKSQERGPKGEESDQGGKGRRRSASGKNGLKKRDASKQEKSSKVRDEGKREEPAVNEREQGPSLEEQAALAEDFVGGLAERFGTTLTFERDELKDEILRIEASGEDIGLLVGRKGATAQAIDDLVRTVLQRAGGTTREGKIRVDIGGVRARRAEALAEFTRKVAVDVATSGKETVLEPMGGADRKLVHDVVSEIEGVETRSEGEDPHRRVVIVPLASES